MDEKMKFGIDLTDALKSEEILINLFNQIAEGMTAVGRTSVNLTASGKLVSASFDAITSEGKAVSATIKGLTDNVVTLDEKLQAFTARNAEGITGIINPKDIARLSSVDYGSQKVNKDPTGYEREFANLVRLEKQKEIAYQSEFDNLLRIEKMNDLRYEDEFKNLMLVEKEKELQYRMEYDNLARVEKQELMNAKNEQERAAAQMKFDEQQFQLRERQLDTIDKHNAERAAIQQRRDKETYDMAAREAAKSQAYIDKMNSGRVVSSKTPFDKLFNQAQAIAFGIVISQTFMKIATEITGAVDAAMKFEVRMSELRTISLENQQSVGQWTQQIRGLSDAFGAAADDVAKGTYETLSNQIAKGADTTKFLATAMKFGAATVSSTENSVNLLSSAIKGYHQNTAEAEADAASFYKLIDLGRVKADEIANSMGTVIPIAAQLGISLDDVNAVIATMTQQGVTADNAMTYMRNIMVSLLKPSGAMKETLHGWGVNSGEAALKTFGLVGVMEKLNVIAQEGGLTEIADNFKNIRSILGVSLTAAGENISILKQGVADFKNAGSQYQEAVKIAFESPGKQLEIEFNKIKNMFIFDFGKPLVDGFMKITSSMGGLSHIVSTLSKALAIGATAWAAYKSASAIINNFTAIKDAMSAWIPIITNLEAAWVTLNTAMIANPIGLIAAAAAGIVTYFVLTTKNIKDYMKEYYDEIGKITDKHYEDEKRKLVEDYNATKEGIEAKMQVYLKDAAGIREMYATSKEQIKANFKEMNDSMKGAMDRNIDYLKEQISELKKQIREGEAAIKASFKFASGMQKKIDEKAFRNSLSDSNEADQVGMIEDKAKALGQLADNYNAAGNKDDYQNTVNEQYDLLVEALDITRKTRKEQEQGAKKLAEYDRDRLKIARELEKLDRDAGYKIINEALKHDKNELTYGRGLGGKHPINAMQDHNLNLTKEQVDLSKQADDYLSRKNELKTKLGEINSNITKERDNIKGATDALAKEKSIRQEILALAQKVADTEAKRRSDIEVANAKAKDEEKKKEESVKNLQRLYKEALEFDLFKGTKKSGLTPEQAMNKFKEFTNLKAKIEAAQSGAGLTNEGSLGLTATLADKLQQIKTQADSIFGEERVDKLTKKIEDMTKSFVDSAKKLTEAQDKLFNDRAETIKEFGAAFKAFDSLRGGQISAGDVAGLSQSNTFDDNTKAFELLNKNIMSFLNSDKVSNSEKLDRLVQYLPGLTQLSKNFNADPRMNDNGNTSAQALTTAVTSLSKGQEISKLITANTDELTKTNEMYKLAIQATADVTKQSAAAMNTSMESIVETIKTLKKEAEDLKKAQQLINDSTQIDTVNPPPVPDGYARGGFVSRGTDTVPAMLSPGEFVMNARSVSKYYSQLVSMNAGIRPQYKAEGGPVTSVGDIHINISGGNNTKTSVREIAKELQRGIRRGTVKF